jgi:hypothetical protein
MLLALLVGTLVGWSQAQQYVNDEQSGRQGRIYVSNGIAMASHRSVTVVVLRRCDGVVKTVQAALVWFILAKQVCACCLPSLEGISTLAAAGDYHLHSGSGSNLQVCS